LREAMAGRRNTFTEPLDEAAGNNNKKVRLLRT